MLRNMLLMVTTNIMKENETMNNKCTKCGGDMIGTRLTTGAHMLGVTPIEDAKKFKPRYSNVICDTCIQCGNIENIRAEEPEKLK